MASKQKPGHLALITTQETVEIFHALLVALESKRLQRISISLSPSGKTIQVSGYDGDDWVNGSSYDINNAFKFLAEEVL